jgi:hypothetical protein
MAEPRLSFSQRQGFIGPEITIREGAPEELRRWLLDVVLSLGFGAGYLRPIVIRVTATLPDQHGPDEASILAGLRAQVGSCEWFKVYELIEAFHEFFLRRDSRDTYYSHLACDFAGAVNTFFIDHGIGWQLVDGEIMTRGAEAFEGTVKTAIAALEEDAKPTAAGRLHFAIDALSARPKADTSGAVAHATSAVECVLGEITGQDMTLGEYLNRHPGLFHPALKKGLHGIYGYACDEGARHGKEGTEPTREEAEFAVAVCAAVCTLLTRKHPHDN